MRWPWSVDGSSRPIADIASKSVFDRKAVIGGYVRFGGLALQRLEPLEVCDGVGGWPTTDGPE